MGNRRALLIGIDYKNTAYELGGCINDVSAMYKLLTESRMKYFASNIRCMCDDPSSLTINIQNHSVPSKANIIASMKWLINNVKKGDELFFYVSSHGEQFPCLDGTESDNLNEAIRCINDEFLFDDEIWQTLISKVPSNVKLTCVFDCCHSGTLADLQYCFMYAPGTKNIFSMNIEKNKSVSGNIVCFSACYDSDLSGDSSFDGKFVTLPNGQQIFDWGTKMGCFTYYLIKTLTECACQIECSELLKATFIQLEKNGYSQMPECTCSQPQLFTGKF